MDSTNLLVFSCFSLPLEQASNSEEEHSWIRLLATLSRKTKWKLVVLTKSTPWKSAEGIDCQGFVMHDDMLEEALVTTSNYLPLSASIEYI
jgi:hypothetical protein